jgi:nucleoside-diphosphate-sugar epimerase
MQILIIGGTGTISEAVTKNLLAKEGNVLYLLNRGNRKMGEVFPSCPNLHWIEGDIHNEDKIAEAVKYLEFDVVIEFVAFRKEDAERDFRLFRGKTKQYLFLSSASVYDKSSSFPIREDTAQDNPYWAYSREKQNAEKYLLERFRLDHFPVTIVRPSHTYDEKKIPVAIHGQEGSYSVVERIQEEKPVLLPGDGSTLWTLTYSGDFAAYFSFLVGNPEAVGETYQIMSDERLTWLEIYTTIARTLRVKLHPYFVSSYYLAEVGKKRGYDFEGTLLGDKKDNGVFDTTKIKNLAKEPLPFVPFSEGVRRCLNYIASHKECQTPDPDFDFFTERVILALEDSKKHI